jgi:hypothetical protein
MSRIYSVKSNARRDCRKLGLSPDLVIAKGSGWVIDYPDAPVEKSAKPEKPAKAAKPPKAPKVKAERKAKAAKPPKAAKAPRTPSQPREGEPKRDRLISMLADWTPLTDLMSAMGWQAHTVRGALSTAAKTRGVKIERQRVEGVSSYRVAG